MITRPVVLDDKRSALVNWLTSQASSYGVSFAKYAMQWIHEHSVHGDGIYWSTYPNQGDYDWPVANLWAQIPDVSYGAWWQKPEMLCGNYAELMRQLVNRYTGTTTETGVAVLTAAHSFIDPATGNQSFQDHVVIEIREHDSGGRFGVFDLDYGVCYINANGMPNAGQVATLSDLLAPSSPSEFKTALIPWAGPNNYGWTDPKVTAAPDPNALVDGDFFVAGHSYRRGLSIVNKSRVDPAAPYTNNGGVTKPFRQFLLDRLISTGGNRDGYFEIGGSPPV